MISKKMIRKIENNIKKIGCNLREYKASNDGIYIKDIEDCIPLSHIFSWTQSFMTGMALWAYVENQNQELLKWVYSFYEEYYAKIFETPLETMHDLGFLYSPYAVAMYDITGDENMKKIGVKAADELAKRFEPKGGYIRAWGRMDYQIPDYVDGELAKDHFFTESNGVAIVDCMMNLPLLFWASEVTKHPYYKRIAMMHADTTLKYFVREDDSICHAYRFSEETGEPIGEENYCGYGIGSHWARGTAWAIYGFAIAYRYTKKQEYLNVSIKVLEKFISESKGEIPVWDFRLPANEAKNIDTSASAITLCGMYEILEQIEDKKLEAEAEKILKQLERYIDEDDATEGLLKEQNGKKTYTLYGDYFLIEALCKRNLKLRVW